MVRAYPESKQQRQAWNVNSRTPRTCVLLPEPGSHPVTTAGPWGPRDAKSDPSQPHGEFTEG